MRPIPGNIGIVAAHGHIRYQRGVCGLYVSGTVRDINMDFILFFESWSIAGNHRPAPHPNHGANAITRQKTACRFQGFSVSARENICRPPLKNHGCRQRPNGTVSLEDVFHAPSKISALAFQTGCRSLHHGQIRRIAADDRPVVPVLGKSRFSSESLITGRNIPYAIGRNDIGIQRLSLDLEQPRILTRNTEIGTHPFCRIHKHTAAACCHEQRNRHIGRIRIVIAVRRIQNTLLSTLVEPVQSLPQPIHSLFRQQSAAQDRPAVIKSNVIDLYRLFPVGRKERERKRAKAQNGDRAVRRFERMDTAGLHMAQLLWRALHLLFHPRSKGLRGPAFGKSAIPRSP